MKKEVLPPVVKGDSPGIGDLVLGTAFEVPFGGVEAVEAAVGAANGSIGGFDVTVEENPFAHVDSSGGVGAEGGDGVVSIAVIKAAYDDLFKVGFVIAVGVFKEDEVVSQGDEDAVFGDFKSHGDVDVFEEVGLFVSFAVAVGVFEDDDFIIRSGVSDLVVGVALHAAYPEAAPVVEGHLGGVDEVGEFVFGGEEFDFVAFGDFEVFGHVFATDVFVEAVGICFDGLEFDCLGVCSGQVEGLALAGGPERLVAEGGHLASFDEFVWVVDTSVRVVATAVDVDAVGDFIVEEPEAVFFGNGGVDFLTVTFGSGDRGSVEFIDEGGSELAVSFVGEVVAVLS